MLNRRSILTASIAAALGRLAPSLPAAEPSNTVSFELDAAPLTNALNSFAELFESGCQVSEGLLALLECPQQLFRFECDCLTAGAYKTVVRLYPSDALLAAVAACRAGNQKSLIVEEFPACHDSASCFDRIVRAGYSA